VCVSYMCVRVYTCMYARVRDSNDEICFSRNSYRLSINTFSNPNRLPIHCLMPIGLLSLLDEFSLVQHHYPSYFEDIKNT
jgi:hypothetical protein